MSATDELRRMLDERGVEWGNIRKDGTESDFFTEWQLNDSRDYAVAIEWAVGGGLSVKLCRHNLTPEQSIAVTLGKQGYYADRNDEGTHIMCDRCGEYIGTAEAIAATLGVGDKSRWAELFGTPERAARTMATQCFGATSEACDTCVFDECDGKLRNSGTYLTVYDTLLEWLRGDA